MINCGVSCANDYIKAIITDEDELFYPIGNLKKKYPNILKLEFKNKRYIDNNSKFTACGNVKKRTPLDLFEEFYLNQNNVSLDDDLREVFINTLKEVSNETN